MSACLHFAHWLIAMVLLAGHAHAAERSIYRCVDAGVTTFTDRPCGVSTQVYSYEVSVPVVEEPSAVVKPAAAAKTPPSRKPRGERAEPGTSAREANCERIQGQLQQLRARMRAGYGAAEGERLREQQRTARARARQLRCR